MSLPVNSRSARTVAYRQPLFGHQRVGAVLVEAHEGHDSRCGVLDVRDGGEAGVEMAEIGRDVPLDELAWRDRTWSSKWWKKALLRAGRLGDHLVDRGRAVALFVISRSATCRIRSRLARHPWAYSHCFRLFGLVQTDQTVWNNRREYP